MSQPTKVELRPARQTDFDELVDEKLPWRVRAFAAERGGKLLGVGGLAFQPGDTVAAFLILAPSVKSNVRRYRLALHKAGLRVMHEARRLGVRRVVAMAEKNNPAAEPWLERLGFRPVQVNGETAWTWRDDRAQ